MSVADTLFLRGIDNGIVNLGTHRTRLCGNRNRKGNEEQEDSELLFHFLPVW